VDFVVCELHPNKTWKPQTSETLLCTWQAAAGHPGAGGCSAGQVGAAGRDGGRRAPLTGRLHGIWLWVSPGLVLAVQPVSTDTAPTTSAHEFQAQEPSRVPVPPSREVHRMQNRTALNPRTWEQHVQRLPGRKNAREKWLVWLDRGDKRQGWLCQQATRHVEFEA
jgi:hypothetical protein